MTGLLRIITEVWRGDYRSMTKILQNYDGVLQKYDEIITGLWQKYDENITELWQLLRKYYKYYKSMTLSLGRDCVKIV